MSSTLGSFLSEFVVIFVAVVFAFSFGQTGAVLRDLRKGVAKLREFVQSGQWRKREEVRWAPFAMLATVGPLVFSYLTKTERLLPEQSIAVMLVLAAALVAGYFAFLQRNAHEHTAR